MHRNALGWLVFGVAALSAALVGMTPPIAPTAGGSVMLHAGGADLANYQIVKLDLPAPGTGGFTIVLTLEGIAYRVELRPTSLRADDFRLTVIGAEGVPTSVEAPPARTFKGTLPDLPGAKAAVSLLDGGLSGLIRMPGGEVWGVQPLSDIDPKAPHGIHVVYRASDALVNEPFGCGADGAPAEDAGAAGGGIAGTGLHKTDIAFDTDVEFYMLNGSNVADTLFDIENVLNMVETVYETQLDISYEVTGINVRTVSDPYDVTTGSGMLAIFGSQWNTMFSSLRRDTAHLMTGRALENGVIGIANIGQLCNTANAYGLSRSRFTTLVTQRVSLTAHEIGHNWNAVHCDGDADCKIMCSFICSCALPCTEFGSRSLAAITAFRDSRNCLDDNQPPPLAPPFFDDFSDGVVDPTRWTYNQFATMTGAALNIPSEPQCLLLNAAGAQDYQDDDIRSNFILLGGHSNMALSYFVEQRLVENGEQLIVDYWSNGLRWVELNRLTSTGIDEEQFTQYTHLLPADAMHDEFRIRFRSAVDSGTDRWFVDDVRVASAAVPATLSVSSTPASGITMTVAPADNNGAGDGATPLQRVYNSGANVTLTAPMRTATLVFCRWSVNGVNQPNGQAALNLAVSANAALVAQYALVGDMDGDGAVNNFDVDPFVLALSDLAAYQQQYPGLDASKLGDCNGDGSFDNFDVDSFVQLLGG